MKPVLVFNERLEVIGTTHNWESSITLGEMDRRCLLITDVRFSPKDALTREDLNCVQCESFDKCFPKLLVKLPEKEEA